MIDATQLAKFAPGCDAATLAPALDESAAAYGIATTARIAHWLAQLHVESGGFKRFRENLNYSAARLCQVWPGRFPTLADAAPFASNPCALAVKVYSNRLGNLTPHDAESYIGRGLIQITGHDNYHHYGEALGVDLVGNPDLAAEPEIAARIAGAFWSEHRLNEAADRDDLTAITRAINGGLTGLVDRRLQHARALGIFA